jgi:hypothetical protein
MTTKTYDGQTGKFLAKVAECMPDVPAHLMQGLIENPQWLKKILSEAFLLPQKFKVWKTIRIGNFQNAEAIYMAFKQSKMFIGSWAEDILEEVALVTSETDINLVALSLEDLGFKKWADYKKICKRAKEMGLELCPAEAGPQLRLQYKDQSDAQFFIIAMEPIADSVGDLEVFEVVGGNELCLRSSCCNATDEFWCSSDRLFVFVLP